MTIPTHTDRIVNGVRLHCLEAGPADGPLVVLLHGFPEDARAWREQLPLLAQAGYRVVAPDMRGYHGSEKPAGVDSYRIETLVADVAGLVADCGRERAHVVGHDWGGIVAWAVATLRPDVVDHLVVLNAPHPGAARSAMLRPQQWAKSWYVGFFQLPVLPERALVPLGRAALRGANKGSYEPGEIAAYADAWREPGAATAMINYYRALLRHGTSPARRIDAPTLVLWGERDVALSTFLLDGLGEWVSDLRVVRFPDATHWVVRDEAHRVGAEIVAFLDS